jgi:predicted Zn-dependent protease
MAYRQQPDPDSYDQRQGQVPMGMGAQKRGCALPPRLMIALVLLAFGVGKWFFGTHKETNSITDQTKRVPWGPDRDVALGLQAAPQMAAQHGGEHSDPRLNALVDKVGEKLLRANAVGDWAPEFNKYRWNFHLLADPNTINAFALPGGQVFFTHGLFSKLETEDEVAGVLGHEIGHVIARHSAQQMAKNSLISGIVQAGTVAVSDGGMGGHQTAQMVQAMLTTKYGRDDETQSDTLGVQFMINAGYNPEGLVRVMKVLKAASGGGSRQPEFLSSHPDPGNRIEHIQAVIKAVREGKLEGPKAVQQ